MKISWDQVIKAQTLPYLNYILCWSWYGPRGEFCVYYLISITVDGFIFVDTNFHGLNENDQFVGFKILGHSIFLHNSYRKLLIHGYWNSWIGPSRKTTKISTPRKLSHPQYILCWSWGGPRSRFCDYYLISIIFYVEVEVGPEVDFVIITWFPLYSMLKLRWAQK